MSDPRPTIDDAIPQPAGGDGTRESRAAPERQELLEHVQDLLEPLMEVLGLLFLVLLVLDFSGIVVSEREGLWLSHSLTVIWAIFIVEFLVRLIIAPRKREYLIRNWLLLASLVLPFLRPFRALQAVRAMRSLSLVKLLGGLNRGIRLLRTIARGSQVAYLAALTVVVMIAGAVGAWYFDRGVEDAPIETLGDAIWWSSTMITTINSEKFVVSTEARIIAILMRIYALSVFGFLTATIAAFLLARARDPDQPAPDPAPTPADALAELAALRAEVVALRTTLADLEAELDDGVVPQTTS